MEFSTVKPIYKQIIDYCHSCIMQDSWEVDGRVPSTKELSLALSVNNRTVLKAFDDMHAAGIIYQKRGLGYFVAQQAKSLIHDYRRREFMETTLPEFVEQMRILNLTAQDILPLLPK